MGKAFESRWTVDLPGTPEQAWEAITVHTGAWLWPISYEPREGGAETGLNGNGGTVTAWDPPRRLGVRSVEGDNELEYRLDGTHLVHTHIGEFAEDEYALQLDSCRQHVDFYLHTLGEYLGHFAGSPAVFVSLDAPEGVGFATVRQALGLPATLTVGERVRLTPDGLTPIDGVVDYATPSFAGVRSADALYRFFGRDTWGWPVGVSVHSFADDNEDGIRKSWQVFLEGVR
ncbi:MAG: hypothetical protein ABW022_02700 [Actinoplanes sp.]